jgi:CheY-like chemotaxis protein
MLDDYNLNALVVDDMAAIRSMMKNQLASIGVTRSAGTPSAAGAIEMLRAAEYNLLLLDYYLGDATDGQQLLELIRNEQLVPSSAVIVMVTAEKNYGLVAQVAEHSPDAYLIKPFTAESLLEHVRPTIERKLGLRQPNRKTPGLKPIYDQFDAKRYDAVIALVDAYTQKEGVHADTARLKGEALLRKGDFVPALAHYQSLPAAYAWAGLGAARARLNLRQTAAAIATLEELVAQTPKYVHASDVLADAYLQIRQPEKALAVLEKACANSSTINRMRAVARIAEQMGDDNRVIQWSGKVIDANKFALAQDYTDHARLVRGLVKSGQADKATAALVRFETETPGVKQSASVQAAKVYTLATQIAAESAALATAPQGMKERRMALLAEKQARLNELSARLDTLATRPEDAVFLAEAHIATGQTERAADVAAAALAHGHRLPEGMGDGEWQRQVEAQAVQKTRDRIKSGLDLLRAGKTREALDLFMQLVNHTPADLTAMLLANVVSTVVMLRQKGEAVNDILPFARIALERLKHEHPDYDRLPGLIEAFERQPPPNA